ncbi:MAG: signal transduction histidine kinase [Pseudohongiellaceae bacterium]|jgi:signal transduction histidine kinase
MTASADHAGGQNTSDDVAARKKDVHWPVRLYVAITVVYIALISWWVVFFSGQGDALSELASEAGAPFGSAQLAVLAESSRSNSLMLMLEGGFMGLLMLASVWLVARALRHERALNRRQRNFLSAITHELRSPIASARLCLDSILLGRTDEQKTERYLRMARVDLDRLSAMAEDVLATRALNEGRAPMNLETVNLSDLVSRSLAARCERPDGDKVVLRVEVDGPVRVHADPAALNQVLDNLVGNALKYGGGRPVAVAVSLAQGKGVLAVSDEGPGLQGAKPKNLTQAFVRGGDEQLRTQPGVGLGLYIVDQIVAAHRGKLSFVERNPGLTVRVALPLAKNAANGDVVSASAEMLS